MLLFQRLMIFQDSEVEMQNHARPLATAVDDAVDHGLPPEFAKMLSDIGFRTHFDIFCRYRLGGPSARMKPMAVWLHPGARMVRGKPRASPSVQPACPHEYMAILETVRMVVRKPQVVHGSVAITIPTGSKYDRMVTGYWAVNDKIERVATAKLLASFADRGCPGDIHHGQPRGVNHVASWSSGGAERYRTFAGDEG